MDKNKSDFIDQPEFNVAFMDRDLLCDKTNLTTLFKDINKKNSDSGVSLTDLKLTLPALAYDNDIAINEMMSQFNLNAEKKITLDEFLKIMRFK
jgi:hypothetical protein